MAKRLTVADIQKKKKEDKKKVQLNFKEKMSEIRAEKNEGDSHLTSEVAKAENDKLFDQAIKKEKRKLKKDFDTKINLLEKNNSNLIQEKNDLLIKVGQLESNKNILKKEILQLTQELDQKNELLQKEKDNYDQIYQQLEELKKKSEDDQIEKLKTKNKKLLQEKIKLLDTNKAQKEEIIGLKNERKKSSAIKQIEVNRGVIQHLNRSREKVASLESKLQKYEEKIDIPFILEILEETIITEENVHIFFSGKKNRLIKVMNKIKSTVEDIKRKERQATRAKKRKNKPAKVSSTQVAPNDKYGYVIFENEKWYFIDLFDPHFQNKKYEVGEVKNNLQLYPDLPVRARIINNFATVIIQFESREILKLNFSKEEKKIENRKTRTKSSNKNKRNRDNLYIGSHQVLIIGSRSLSDYKMELERHGVKVELHNPFEESYSRIKEKVRRANVVLVCTSHVSHATLDHLDKNNPKIQFIEIDNSLTLLARTRVTLLQINNLKQENREIDQEE